MRLHICQKCDVTEFGIWLANYLMLMPSLAYNCNYTPYLILIALANTNALCTEISKCYNRLYRRRSHLVSKNLAV